MNIVKPSFHRMIFNVMAAGETLAFSSPVLTEGGEVEVDISSALRSVFDGYVWTPNTVTTPSATWTVEAYDEYMTDGEVKRSDKITLQGTATYPGGFSDYERITAQCALPRWFSRKPTSSPEIVAVGETVCLPATGNRPQSRIVTVTTEGMQTEVNAYAVPVDKNAPRLSLRFVNAFGCLESISVPRAYQRTATFTAQEHIMARQERFDTPSHVVVRKQGGTETWRCTSDPVDREWQQWFLHDLLMAEQVWVNISGTWIRVHIIPEEEITYRDETKSDMYLVTFGLRFDINGGLRGKGLKG